MDDKATIFVNKLEEFIEAIIDDTHSRTTVEAAVMRAELKEELIEFLRSS